MDSVFTLTAWDVILLAAIMLTTVIVYFYLRDFGRYACKQKTQENKRKMADKEVQHKMADKEVQQCLHWLFDQKGSLETAPWGRNKTGNQEALRIHHARSRNIIDFKDEVNSIIQKHDTSDDDALVMKGTYESLNTLTDKRLSCLTTINQIADLEEQVQTMALDFDSRAVHLVNMAENNKLQGAPPSQSNASLARTSQNCISAVRNSWSWVRCLLSCADVQLKNAAAYQEYFNEVDEVEYWMNSTMSRIHLSFDRSRLVGDRADVEAMLEEIRDVLLAYLQWQGKVDSLFERSRNIVPVPARIRPVEDPRAALSLVDYNTAEIEFSEGESLKLLDNSERGHWKVQNVAGQVGRVPAVILVIPGPSGEAVDAAVKLRIQLLSLWTTSIKRLGYQMIAFMLIVIRDWSDEEVNSLQSMSAKQHLDLLRILNYIEDTLLQHWGEYEQFQELQERILRLRMILEDSTNNDNEDDTVSTVVVQIAMLEDLLKKYKDFWAYWETYKVVVELLRQPKYILLCEKWEQMRFVTTAHFVKFWDTHLELDETVSKLESLTLFETPKQHMEVNADITVGTESQVSKTDTIETSLEEEQQTFVIRAVVDPRTNTQISIQDAIVMGVMDQANGLYVNPDTRESISIAQAMNNGKIIVEIVSIKKTKEEKKTFGLITINTTKETRPYHIESVIDPHTDLEISVTEATQRGILNVQKGLYRSDNSEYIPLIDAIESGCVKVEYKETSDRVPSETISRTYSVHSVVDVLNSRKESFADAIDKGLLDKDSGNFINNKTGEIVFVSEAIKRGFIKARIVTDENSLDVDPSNRIIIQKFEHAKDRLFRGVKAVKAFQAAGKLGKK